jgi:hypothetical protein
MATLANHYARLRVLDDSALQIRRHGDGGLQFYPVPAGLGRAVHGCVEYGHRSASYGLAASEQNTPVRMQVLLPFPSALNRFAGCSRGVARYNVFCLDL